MRMLFLVLILATQTVATQTVAAQSVGEIVMPKMDATYTNDSGEVLPWPHDSVPILIQRVQGQRFYTGLHWIESRHVVLFADAIAYYSDHLSKNPKSSLAYFRRGTVRLQQYEPEKAVSDFTLAIEIQPDDAACIYSRGVAHSMNNDLDGAIRDFTETVELKPDAKHAWYLRGQNRFQQGKFEMAIEDYTEVIRLDPEFVQVYFCRGVSWEQEEKFQNAIDDYTEQIRIKPAMHHVCHALAWLYISCPEKKLRNPKAAIKYATRACELTDWNQPVYLDGLAAAYAKDGNFPKAVELETRAIELAGDSKGPFQVNLMLYQNGTALFDD